MNNLLIEIFAGIFVSIAIMISQQQWLVFQIRQLRMYTQYSVILACHWWYKLFFHWWMKGIYFASFYFRVYGLTREIRENKNPAKISTYTVLDPKRYLLNLPSVPLMDAPVTCQVEGSNIWYSIVIHLFFLQVGWLLHGNIHDFQVQYVYT